MAKKKDNGGGGGSGGGSGGCRPAHSRVSFLFQAAALLASTPAQGTAKTTTTGTTTTGTTTTGTTTTGTTTTATTTAPAEPPSLQGMSRRLLVQMRAVSRKTNMRVRPAVKQRVCRYCDTLLVEGTSCTSSVENASRGGRKPWADVLVVACHTCGRAARRYPVAAARQPRRPMRGGEEMEPGCSEVKGKGKGKEQPADKTTSPAKGKNTKNTKNKHGGQPAGQVVAAGEKTPG